MEEGGAASWLLIHLAGLRKRGGPGVVQLEGDTAARAGERRARGGAVAFSSPLAGQQGGGSGAVRAWRAAVGGAGGQARQGGPGRRRRER